MFPRAAERQRPDLKSTIVDGQKVSSTEEVNEIRDKKKAGDYLTFKILRDGETMEVQVRLMEDSADKTK